MRIANKPTPLSVYLSRADELERKFGYARIARRMRYFLKAGDLNEVGRWTLVLAERAAERESR